MSSRFYPSECPDCGDRRLSLQIIDGIPRFCCPTHGPLEGYTDPGDIHPLLEQAIPRRPKPRGFGH